MTHGKQPCKAIEDADAKYRYQINTGQRKYTNPIIHAFSPNYALSSEDRPIIPTGRTIKMITSIIYANKSRNDEEI